MTQVFECSAILENDSNISDEFEMNEDQFILLNSFELEV